MNRKIYAYGMDGFITPMMKLFAAEGCLPNFKRMLTSGSVNQTLPSFPVWTPTNWATLSTGAHTGTHGVSTWQTSIAQNKEINSFDGRANNAERIWNALERASLKGVAVHYPGAHPSGVQSGFVVDGFGHPGHAATDFEVAACQAYTTVQQQTSAVTMGHDGAAVEGQRSVEPIPPPQRADGWQNLPLSHAPPLATEVEIRARLGDDVNTLHLLLVDSRGQGYDTVQLCRHEDGDTRIAQTHVGEWSEWAIEALHIDGREQRASLRFKLLHLSADGQQLKIYRSQATYADGWTYGNPELETELVERFGPYQEHASMTPYTSGMTDFDTALEECEYQGLWFADVANYMLWERDCSYFTCHWHLYDYLNHIHLDDVDPAGPGYEPAQSDAIMDYFRRAYIVGDRILGRMWEAIDAHVDVEAYLAVLADHGAYPDIRIANIRQFLVDSGFLVLKSGHELVARDSDKLPDDAIDWEQTKAYMKRRGFDISINAAEGSPQFAQIERDLLTALRTWVDEETGATPVAIALPKRDAYLLGQWGDQCGDVIFAWDHGYVSGYYAQWQRIVGGGNVGAPEVYGAHHGGFLPTQSELSSSFGSFLLAGPSVKSGYERPTEILGYIHAAEVVPTFCHILGVEPPAQAQGAISYDLFVGHEMVRRRESD